MFECVSGPVSRELVLCAHCIINHWLLGAQRSAALRGHALIDAMPAPDEWLAGQLDLATEGTGEARNSA